ncbi:TPA: DEAD/DEAH box helicase [Methanopyrus kandleri]|uniref:DEAD/DEAH box helicase n=1 Tax=Methanopyrus kandleri TaxID=2320 RepID=A0A832TD27_9EURY|nr:helicase-related protein [Methanopyrus kandleri]HII70613.1 DEAD/DEAH box helicase [Methanopyrus kandleri]
MEARWELEWEGEEPEGAGIPLSRFSKRLPDVEAYRHQVETAEAFENGHVLLTAGMGAGKTEAALAAIEHERTFPAVFVYPTKALARDQAERMIRYGYDVVIADGDHPGWRARIQEAEIVVTNPQMIWIHARRGLQFWEFLTDVARCLVWDEVHFYGPRQVNLLLGIVRALRDRRHLFMSGTVGHPDSFCGEVERATGETCTHVRGRGKMAPRKFVVRNTAKMADLLEDITRYVREDSKTLVFFRTRAQAEHAYQVLCRRYGLEGYVTLHHGALPRDERRRAEREFKRGRASVMITVKTLEVGIDVGSVTRVVHYGIPDRVSDFWQREGRAGRRGQEAESVIYPADPWTSFVTRTPRRFREAYLEGKVERILAYAQSHLAAPPESNPTESFYGEKDAYRVVREDNPRAVLRDQVDPEDVPRAWAPGCAFRAAGEIWVVSGPPDRETLMIPAVPAEEYDPTVAQLIEEGWWTYPRIEVYAEGEEECGIGYVELRWTDTVLSPPPDEPERPILLEHGDITIRVKAYYIRLEDPDLRRRVGADSAEHAVHALNYALKLKHGVPLSLLNHYVHRPVESLIPEESDREAFLLIYESPPAVMPLLEWESAVEEAIILARKENPRNLRLPRCPWPKEDVVTFESLIERYLLGILQLAEKLREREGLPDGVEGRQPKCGV